MVKILLLICIIAASWLLGRAVSAGMAERAETARALVAAVRYMKNGMICQNMTFSEALRHGGKLSGFALFTDCADISEAEPSSTGRAAAAKALSRAKELRLSKEDAKCLIELLDNVCTAMDASQVEEAAERFVKEMGARLDELVEEQRRRSKLARSVCLLMGLAVAIILA